MVGGSHQVMDVIEDLVKSIWKVSALPGTVINDPLPDTPITRMKYDEAMSKHGSDKPDLRIKGLVCQPSLRNSILD